ncbi:CGNR zinc finger domain-containing protein [Kineococcus gypseus]|uniref:CGNR zinc finger domain-containing protein n=1 Tax=Kineococcus gypseus TaxID=1637102 RepID=UPI003D7E2113
MLETAPADPTGPAGAPAGGLDLVERFLNTLDERTFHRHGQQHTRADELTSPEALDTWLRAHGLPAGERAPGPAELAAARSLRDALRAALTTGLEADGGAGSGSGSGDAAAAARAARALAGFPLRLVPDPAGRLRLGAGTGVPGLDAVVEAVAAGVAAGRWGRLKLCAAPDCRWAFHDTSRSGGGRWCSMGVCGNRHKTRTYRRRRAD